MKDRPTVYVLIELETKEVLGVYAERIDADQEIRDRVEHERMMGEMTTGYAIECWRVT